MKEKEKSIYYILHILVLKEDTYQRKTVGVLKKEKISDYYPDEYDFKKGRYLFNNCHLIAHQLLKKDELNESEFIVGARYMNERGMSQFKMRVKNCLNNKNKLCIISCYTDI